MKKKRNSKRLITLSATFPTPQCKMQKRKHHFNPDFSSLIGWRHG
jgi:hypothetical protein